jgi:hypothetical protein
MTPRPKMLSLQPAVGASAQAWAARIAACWRASVEAILEVGRLLEAAKEALDHGEFGKMIETELPFGERTAQMLMSIAADPQISNPKFISHLPANWGALYELSTLKLDEEQFAACIEKGSINPDLDRKTLIKGARSIMGSRQEPDDSLDFFPTPPWATRALMQVVLGGPFNSIWEPACGYGHMSEVLREYCERVHATDIFDYGGYPNDVMDFLRSDLSAACDWIITNPPFGDNTEKFVLAAIKKAQIGVAMFVRLQWLESVGRYETIFRDHPPTCIAFFAERVPLCKGEWKPDGTTATAYIWLVWIKDQEPRPPFWIPPGQRERLTYADDAARFTSHPVIRKEDFNPETGEVRIADESGTNHKPEFVHDSVGTDARQSSKASVSEPASAEPTAPHMPVDAGLSSSLPEIILPGMAPTFEYVAAFTDLTPAGTARAS